MSARRTTAPRTRRAKALAWILAAVLLGAPLLALALLSFATLGFQQHPVQTGDALVDAYLQGLIDTDLVANPAVQWQDYSFSYTSDARRRDVYAAQWRNLEQRFGNTADYWLLCHAVRTERQRYLSPVAGVEFLDGEAYLEQARAAGVADWRVDYWLLRDYSREWEQEAAAALGLREPGSSRPPAEHVSYYTQCGKEVERRHGAVRRELRAELARAGAREAQAQYLLALDSFAQGDLAGAQACIAAGNAAPHNSVAHSPHVAGLLAAAAQGAPLAHDRLLTGKLVQDYLGVPLEKQSRRKSMVASLAQRALEHGDRQALTALQRYCCRSGAARGASRYEAAVGISELSVLLKAFTAAHPQLDAIQAQRWTDLDLGLGKFRNEIRNVPVLSYGSTLPLKPLGLSWLWDALRDVSDGGRAWAGADLELACADLLAEQALLPAVQRRLAEYAPPLPWEE